MARAFVVLPMSEIRQLNIFGGGPFGPQNEPVNTRAFAVRLPRTIRKLPTCWWIWGLVLFLFRRIQSFRQRWLLPSERNVVAKKESMRVICFDAHSDEVTYFEKNQVSGEVVFEAKRPEDAAAGDATAEALSVFVGVQVTDDFLAKFPALKFIATRSTGYDH